jgi:FMN phosphatase YigB (HAD superfamily)
MGVDPRLLFSSIKRVLGPVRVRDLNDYRHVTDSGILGQILEENEYPEIGQRIADVKAVFMEGLSNHINDQGSFPVIDGALQFVERIRESQDVRVAIATGCWRESALLKLSTSGFNIDGIPLASCDDSPSRVEIMRSALRMAGGSAREVTYFGDGEWDLRACKELGWQFVAVGPRLGGIESFSDIQV